MTGIPIRLGTLRLTDAAPVIYAQAHGLFAGEGLDVSLTVEPSWANIADKLAWKLLDGAVMLPPLAIAMALGLRGPVTRTVIPTGISRNGNAITLARRLAEPVLAGGRPDPVEAAVRLRRALTGKPRLAVVHAFSTHDFLLRLFLERGGIDPIDGVEMVVVPPADLPAALAAGVVDGFCAGAPWGAVAARDGVGHTVAVSSEICPDHPEKCLALGAGWATGHPEAVRALVRAVARAAAACERPEGTGALAALLARPEWVGVDAPLIAASLPGGAGGEVDRSSFAAATATGPEQAAWFVQQMGRWRTLPPGAETVAASLYVHDA